MVPPQRMIMVLLMVLLMTSKNFIYLQYIENGYRDKFMINLIKCLVNPCLYVHVMRTPGFVRSVCMVWQCAWFGSWLIGEAELKSSAYLTLMYYPGTSFG